MNWISTKEKPIILKKQKGDSYEYEPTSHCPQGPFMAAVPLSNGKWYIRQVIMDGDTMGCLLDSEGETDPCGYEPWDIEFYMVLTPPPHA